MRRSSMMIGALGAAMAAFDSATILSQPRPVRQLPAPRQPRQIICRTTEFPMNGNREMERRRRQIALGQLTVANGLQPGM